jgi:hypothetical protein
VTVEQLQPSVLPVAAWLMTYAVHSTLLLGGAALVAWRSSDEHWWLTRLWKAAMLGAIVTTSVQIVIEHEPRLIVACAESSSGARKA